MLYLRLKCQLPLLIYKHAQQNQTQSILKYLNNLLGGTTPNNYEEYRVQSQGLCAPGVEFQVLKAATVTSKHITPAVWKKVDRFLCFLSASCLIFFSPKCWRLMIYFEIFSRQDVRGSGIADIEELWAYLEQVRILKS